MRHQTLAAGLNRMLKRIGVQLTLNGNTLLCHAPSGVMTNELRMILQTHKAALMQTLKA